MEEIKRYVAPWGDDTAPGTESAPLATLRGARDAVRRIHKEQGTDAPVCVLFRGGNYCMQESVLFDSRDSGSEQAPVRYAAYPGEHPRFIGGYTMRGADAVSVPAGEMFDRLPKEARQQIRMLDAGAFMASLTPCCEQEYAFAFSEKDNMFSFPSSQDSFLFIDGRRYEPARYPNRDKSLGFSWRCGSYASATDMVHLGAEARSADFRLSFDEETAQHVRSWSKKALTRLFIWGHFFADWYDCSYRVDDIDFENGTLLVKGGTGSYSWSREAGKKPFFFCNLPEELDQAGECYFDFEEKKIYFYPEDDFTADSEIMISSMRTPMLHTDGASYLRFENLDFIGGCEAGVHFENGAHITAQGGEWAHFSHCSALINDAHDITLRSLHIHDNGRDGINIERCGDCKTLTNGNILIENCRIHDVSVVKKCQTTTVGTLDCCGVTIRGCSLYNSAMSLIAPSNGNDLLIENNDIYNACLDSDDCGAISWCRTPAIMGTVIRNNYFHNIGNRWAQFGIHAIYIDDFSVGPEIYNNIFDHCAMSAQPLNVPEDGFYMIGHTYGSFISVHNNIFVCHDNEKPMLNMNCYAFPLWITFVNDSEAIAAWENYHWREVLEKRGFFTETWRRHYRGTQWERMWDFCNDAHRDAFRKIFDEYRGDDPIEPQAQVRMAIYEEIWDHRDAKGNIVHSSLKEYIEDVYRIVLRTYRGIPKDPKEVRPPLLHLVEDLLYDDKIHYASSWVYENNVTVGMRDEYLAPNRVTWGHGARGTEQNLNLVVPTDEKGASLFKADAPDYTLTAEGLAYVRRTLPEFSPIDTSVIGCKGI